MSELKVFCNAPTCRKWVSENVPCEAADIRGRLEFEFETGICEASVGCTAYDPREEHEADE